MFIRNKLDGKTMVDAGLLARLDEKHVINRRSVMWWQLGFEGRKVISEAEFASTLQTVSYPCKSALYDGAGHRYVETRSFRVWPRDDVPIVLRQVRIGEETFDGFVTVCPMSHRPGGRTGWEDLDFNQQASQGPMSIYRTPHIRGVVVEKTPEFLFWSPVTFSHKSEATYFTRCFMLGDTPCLISPIDTSKFCRTLIQNVWHKGTRPQKKPAEMNSKSDGFDFVPYYEFDPAKNHVTIYPGVAFPGRFDLPIVIRGNPSSGRPSIVGVGYVRNHEYEFSDDMQVYCRSSNDEKGAYSVFYWELDKRQERAARNSLIARLGRL